MNQYNSIDPYGTYDVKGLSPYEMAMKMASWNQSLRSTLVKTNEDLSNVESVIVQHADAIGLRVMKEDYTGEIVASMIALDPYSVTIIANSLNLSGYVTFSALSGAGTTVINGANIMTGSILANRLAVAELSAISADLGIVTAGYLRGVVITGSNMTMRDGNLMWDEGIPAYYSYVRASVGALYLNASQSVNVNGRLNALSGLSVSGGTINFGGMQVFGASVFNGGNMAFNGDSISFNGVANISGVPKSTTSGLEFGYASGSRELVVRINGSEQGRIKLV